MSEPSPNVIEESSENTIREIDFKRDEPCPESLKCDYCDFIGKTEGGLKTHMRFKHTRIMNQQNWKHCTFCNFNCKTESEMKTHVSEYGATHSQKNNKNNGLQLNNEIRKLTNNGYILFACESGQAQMTYFEQQQQKSFSYNC